MLRIEHDEETSGAVDDRYITEPTDLENADFPGQDDVLRVMGVITEDARSLFVSDPFLVEGEFGTTDAVFEVSPSRPSSDALRLSEASSRDVTVTVRIVGDTADPATDVDFSLSAGVTQLQSVTIPAGQTTLELYLEQNEETANEADEVHAIELTDPQNAALAGGGDVLRASGVTREDGRNLFVGDPILVEGDDATEGEESFFLLATPIDDAEDAFEDFSVDNVGRALIRDDDADDDLPEIGVDYAMACEGATAFFVVRLSEPSSRPSASTSPSSMKRRPPPTLTSTSAPAWSRA